MGAVARILVCKNAAFTCVKYSSLHILDRCRNLRADPHLQQTPRPSPRSEPLSQRDRALLAQGDKYITAGLKSMAQHLPLHICHTYKPAKHVDLTTHHRVPLTNLKSKQHILIIHDARGMDEGCC